MTENRAGFWYDGAWYDGRRLEMDITDPGWLYGATVFTTLRVYNSSWKHPLTNWQAHRDRLQKSLETFGWQLPDWSRVEAGLQAHCDRAAVLRVTIFPDGRELIFGRSLPANVTQWQQEGISAWVANGPEFRRWYPAHKTGNYLPAWQAKQQAGSVAAQEAILTDSQGNWLETSTGNLWGWMNGCWVTPPATGELLPGIARAQLLQWLKKRRIIVAESPFTPKLVQQLSAIAYSNSVVEVVPIHQITDSDGQTRYFPKIEVVRELQAFWKTHPAAIANIRDATPS